MTNYERIRTLSVDEMACLLFNILHERDNMHLKAMHDAGINASFIGLSPELTVAKHKLWLESECK